jgi:hypothetical protein
MEIATIFFQRQWLLAVSSATLEDMIDMSYFRGTASTSEKSKIISKIQIFLKINPPASEIRKYPFINSVHYGPTGFLSMF